jgi:hypothetical protein
VVCRGGGLNQYQAVAVDAIVCHQFCLRKFGAIPSRN